MQILILFGFFITYSYTQYKMQLIYFNLGCLATLFTTLNITDHEQSQPNTHPPDASCMSSVAIVCTIKLQTQWTSHYRFYSGHCHDHTQCPITPTTGGKHQAPVPQSLSNFLLPEEWQETTGPDPEPSLQWTRGLQQDRVFCYKMGTSLTGQC